MEKKVELPVIDRTKCKGCGLCVSVCSRGGLVLVEKVVTVRPEAAQDCDWCALCESVCPNGAIGCPFEIVIEK